MNSAVKEKGKVVSSRNRLYRSPEIKRRGESTYSDRRWKMMFFELKKFKEKYGHCDVPERYKKYANLVNWCQWQRHIKKYKPRLFKPERFRMLDRLGFNWAPLETHWQKNFEALKQFKKTFGHTDVSRSKTSKHKALAKWTENQRRSYRIKSPWLTPKKKRKLDTIGFRWKSTYTYNKNGQGGYVKVTDLELLKDLNRLHKKLKKIPSGGDINKHGKYAPLTYITRFGGIIKARKKAGMGAAKAEGRQVNDEELLNDLKRLHKLLNKTPSDKDIKKYGRHSPMTYRSHFGSIANAREKAGFERKFEKKNKITDEELLNELIRLKTALKKIPTKGTIVKYGKYSRSVYHRRFGSLKVAREKAGIGYINQTKSKMAESA